MVKELGKVLDLPNAEPADIVKKLKFIPARKLIELCSELAKASNAAEIWFLCITFLPAYSWLNNALGINTYTLRFDR